MNDHDMIRIADRGLTTSLNAAELLALDLDNLPDHPTLIAGDPVAMGDDFQRERKPTDQPGDPVPAERPGDPVPAQRPGDPVPAGRPCAEGSLGDPVACQGKPR